MSIDHSHPDLDMRLERIEARLERAEFRLERTEFQLEQLSFDMCGRINGLNFARTYVDGHSAITGAGASFEQISTCRSVLDS